MKKRKAEDNFIKQPFYEGGDKAMKEFISSHLRYPEISADLGVEGDVHLRYDIDYKGSVTDVKIIGGLDTFCNEEAVRVVKLLRFVVPKIPRHLKVTFHKNITIHFRTKGALPFASFEEDSTKSESGNQSALKLSYTIIPSSGAEVKKNEITYSYTLKT
jgi:TonB family protein